jgi:mannose-6-phosphate isomerase-like protein (cupin superfamily)
VDKALIDVVLIYLVTHLRIHEDYFTLFKSKNRFGEVAACHHSNMGFFTRLEVPRTKVAYDNPIYYGDNNEGVSEFYTPGNKYFGRQVIPWDNKFSDGTPSFMAPVSHYHLLQVEKFYVASGSGIWFLAGEKIVLKAGNDLDIPPCLPHRFESIPNEKTKEPLVILYRYEAQRFEMEEKFFRNTLTYLDDCRRAKVGPSLPQLCIFLSHCWMPGEFIPAPFDGRIGGYISCIINTLFMWTLSLIGQWVYGYRASYSEYYDPNALRKRLEQDSKKGQ